MGKRVSISQPTVIQTELRPLDESFWIDADGSLEQWYYQNTGAFAPDRQITRLKLTPHLSAIDADTNTAYTPTFAVDRWEVKEWNGTQWVTTTITSLSQSDSYSIDTGDGLSLLVTKNNYDGSHAINITCHAKYNDPRDTGVQRWVSESTMLITSIDATQVFPTIDIKNPSARMFNPLKDDPIYEFEGTCDWEGLEGQGGAVITEYKADALGTEEILPANEDMVVNAAPLLDVTYGDVEKTGQQFMSRQTAGGTVSKIVDGVAKITNIKGDTVKLVQLAPDDFTSGTNKGITFQNISNCTLHIFGTSNGAFAQINTTIPYPIVSGHKYYYKTRTSGNVGSFRSYINGRSSSNVLSSNSVGVINDSGSGVFVIYITNNNEEVNFYVTFSFFDLTAMGVDNLTTVEQVEAWLSTHIGNLDYIPYTEGKLVNYGGYSVKWNQLTDVCNQYSANGITITTSKNGYIKINGTATSNITLIFFTATVSLGGHVLYYGTAKELPEGASWGGSYNANYRKMRYTVAPAGFDGSFSFTISSGTTFNNEEYYYRTFDLTLMFGAGNEPDLEWCDKYLSRDYYDYCPSVDRNILDVMETKESGFNVFNGSHTDRKILNASNGAEVVDNVVFYSDYLSVLPNTTYYFNSTFAIGAVSSGICYYDGNKTFISGSAVSENNVAFTRTTPANAKYMRVSGVLSRLSTGCINVSDPSRNGEYEPYHAQYKSPEMGVKTTGFNQFDEEFEKGNYSNEGIKVDGQKLRNKNLIPVISGETYYYKSPVSCNIFLFGADAKTIVGLWTGGANADFDKDHPKGSGELRWNLNTSKAIPSDCRYIAFSTFGSQYTDPSQLLGQFCINISNPSKNGTYEPHWESFSDMSWITKIGIENFNVWDEEWEVGTINLANGQNGGTDTDIRSKNYIKVFPEQRYYIYSGNVQYNTFFTYFYDANKNYFGQSGGFANVRNGILTIPANCFYIRFTLYGCSQGYGNVYRNDICINKSIAHFNGRYYPYGETAPYFPQGLCNVGDVYDEVKVVDGKIKGVVRFGRVDLGSLSWGKTENEASYGGYFFSSSTIGNSKRGWHTDLICQTFETIYGLNKNKDNTISINAAPSAIVQCSKYSDASTFKAAMQGVPLIYELATPYEFEIDYPTKGQFEWYGINGSGQEVPIDQLPVYSQATQPSGYGQHTSKININALYGEDISVILRVKRYPWSANLMPMKVYRNVTWRIPPVDVQVVSDKGGAVRAQNESGNFTFSTIVNQQGDIISDEVKQANMVFDWYYAHIPNSGTAQTVSAGSGLTKAIAASSLKNTKPNNGETPCTNVWCEAFVLGAYHLVNGTYQRTKD